MATESFPTFYSYFLFTKTWAYGLMFITLPAFVAYWNLVLFPDKEDDAGKQCCCKDKK